MPNLAIAKATLIPKPARGFTEAYIVHQLIADLFPETPDRPYLYRVTEQERSRTTALVLASTDVRRMEQIPDRPYGQVVDVKTKAFVPRLRTSQRLDFEIRINATTSVDGRRKEVWDAALQADPSTGETRDSVYRDYLSRKLEGAASILRAHVTERMPVRPRRGDMGGASMFFIATNVVGQLEVTSPDGLIDEIASGIGRAKAFGCGLLCISRPGTVLRRRSKDSL
jgi:CRISPR system Cascade subunit CasE